MYATVIPHTILKVGRVFSCEDGSPLVQNINKIFSLELGYLSSKSGLLTFMDECDLNLVNLGEGGKPCTDYAFTMQAGNKIVFWRENSKSLSSVFF